ncbi:transposase [Streptomyces sp. NBC_00996]|uniref:transposase n=1 Tax=Streptomyces sp. NBC_00996 TaxID=2903710 RepID=UPI00386A890C|nr:transposase [Streptomyces sp. NBC_00996]
MLRSKNQPKGFGWCDYRDLLIRDRIQFGGPIVLVWDNVRLHLSKPLREFITARADQLTFFQLPACAPDLNPTTASGRSSSATSAISPPSTSAR